MTTSLHSHSKSYFSDLYQAKKTWSARCLRAPRASGFRALAAASGPRPEENVVGVGIGEKLDDGRSTGIIAIKFFVRRKYAPNQLTKKELLPKFIDGLPVDVEQTGQFRPLVAKKGKPRKRLLRRARPEFFQTQNNASGRRSLAVRLALRIQISGWPALLGQWCATARASIS